MPLTELPMGVLPASSTNVLSAATLLNAGGTQTILTDDAPSCSTSPSTINSVVVPQPIFNRISHHITFHNPVYLNSSAHMDYLDSSSSATSACLLQNDGSLQQNLPLSSFNQASLFRSTLPDRDVPGTYM